MKELNQEQHIQLLQFMSLMQNCKTEEEMQALKAQYYNIPHYYFLQEYISDKNKEQSLASYKTSIIYDMDKYQQDYKFVYGESFPVFKKESLPNKKADYTVLNLLDEINECNNMEEYQKLLNEYNKFPKAKIENLSSDYTGIFYFSGNKVTGLPSDIIPNSPESNFNARKHLVEAGYSLFNLPSVKDVKDNGFDWLQEVISHFKESLNPNFIEMENQINTEAAFNESEYEEYFDDFIEQMDANEGMSSMAAEADYNAFQNEQEDIDEVQRQMNIDNGLIDENGNEILYDVPESETLEQNKEDFNEVKINNELKNRTIDSATNYVLEKLSKAGIEVVTDKEEFEKIIATNSLLQKMYVDIREFENTQKQIQMLKEQNENIKKDNHALIREQSFIDFQTSLIACKKFMEDLPEKKLSALQYKTKTENGEDIIYPFDIKILNSELVLMIGPNVQYNFETKQTEIERGLEKFKDFNLETDCSKVLIETINNHLGKQLGEQRRIFKQLMEENAVLSGKDLNELSPEETKELKEQEYENVEGIFVHKDKKIAVTPDVYVSEIQNAKLLVDQNYTVYLLPENFAFRRKNEKGRNESYSTPDTLTNDEFVELKTTNKKIGSRFGDAVEQSNNVLIRIKDDISLYNARKRLQEKINSLPKEKNINVKNGYVFLYFEQKAQFVFAEIKNGKIAILPQTPSLSDLTGSRPANINISEKDDLSSIQNMVSNGITYGFTHEGKIYLNPDVMNSNAAVHEYTHLWDSYTQKTDPKLWQKGLTIFKDTNYWKEVLNDPNYQDIKYDENLVLSEIHSRICGKMAEKNLEKIAELDGEQVKFDAIDWDNEVNEFIAEEFGIKPELGTENYISDSYKAALLKDFLSAPMKDLFINERNFEIERENKTMEEMTDEVVVNEKRIFNPEIVERNSLSESDERRLQEDFNAIGNFENAVGQWSEYSNITNFFDFHNHSDEFLKFMDAAREEKEISGHKDNISFVQHYLENKLEIPIYKDGERISPKWTDEEREKYSSVISRLNLIAQTIVKSNETYTELSSGREGVIHNTERLELYGAKDITELEKTLQKIKDELNLNNVGQEKNMTDSTEELSLFDKELQEFIDGKLPKSHIFTLGKPSEILVKCGFPGEQRIELSASHLEFKSKLDWHPFELKDVMGLEKALKNPIAVFEYGDRKKSQNVIINIEKDGKNFLAGVHFNQEHNGFEISTIRTLFPKDTVEWLNWMNQGKMIYGNKEKLQALIAQQRINVADVNSQVVQSPLYEHCLESSSSILDKFGEVKDIFTDEYPFYKEVKKKAAIEQKFFNYYVTKGNLDSRELSVFESKEFYNALKSGNTQIIDEYTKTDLHEIKELAAEIYEEFSKEKEVGMTQNLSAVSQSEIDNPSSIIEPPSKVEDFVRNDSSEVDIPVDSKTELQSNKNMSSNYSASRPKNMKELHEFFINNPYTSGTPVPTIALRNGQTGHSTFIEGYEFARFEDIGKENPAFKDENGNQIKPDGQTVVLTKSGFREEINNETGEKELVPDEDKRKFIRISRDLYEQTLKNSEIIAERNPKTNEEHLKMIDDYLEVANLDEKKQRANTASNFWHNYQAGVMTLANNKQEAMAFAKRLVNEMIPSERKKFAAMVKNYEKIKGADGKHLSYDQRILERYEDITKGLQITNKSIWRDHVDKKYDTLEMIKQNTEVFDREGQSLDKTCRMKIGDTIKMSVTVDSALSNKKIKLPPQEFKLVAHSKDGNSVALISVDGKQKIIKNRDDFIKEVQKVEKKLIKKQQKQDRYESISM